MKVKPLKKKTNENVMVCDEVEESASNLRRAMQDINEVVIGRTDEIAALELCLITRQHLMLEGPPGIAKSALATEAFKRIDGDDIVFFKKQLTSSTQTDEIFGPLDARKYKEEAEYIIRTEGYLPSAHFAFLDEVYRAANMILPSILGILNEREFSNGTQHLVCPLRTAIATSNFTSDNPELEAFHDRWLVRVNSQPLSTADMRLKALHKHLSYFRDETKPKRVTMGDLDVLYSALSEVNVHEDTYLLYDEMVQNLRRALSNVYISDRRYCQAFRLALAAFLLEDGEADASKLASPMDPAMLYAARFGLIVVNKTEHQNAFEQSYSHVVGNYSKDLELSRKLSKADAYSQSLESKYEEAMDPEDLAALYVKTKRAMSAVASVSNVASPQMTNKLNKITRRLESLDQTISPQVDMKLVTILVEKMKKDHKA